MKKIIFTLLAIICFIGIANAKEYCTVISGTGENLGDEIACGTEHFYVIGNDDNNIQMLSKYNLYVGANYNKVKLDTTKTYIRYECNTTYNYCNSNPVYVYNGETVSNYTTWENKIKEEFNLDFLQEIYWIDESESLTGTGGLYQELYGDQYTIEDKTYRNVSYKIYPYTIIDKNTEGYALQNEIALGVTGEKGNANYPINATLRFFYQDAENQIYIKPLTYYVKNLDNFENGYTNFEFKTGIKAKGYLNDYKNNLNDMGYEVSKVDIITMEDLNNLVKAITGEELPLSEWYEDSRGNSPIDEEDNSHYILGDLKEILGDEYSWVWATSYLTRTLYGNENEIAVDDENGNGMVYFVSAAGDICYSYSNCWSGIPRAGIRPVVTISKDSLIYSIETKTDGNGTIKAEKVKAKGGEVIKFTIEPSKGYVLGTILVTDANGHTIKVESNTFTMPDANVLIEATFEKVNPKTSDIAITTAFIGLIITFTIMMISYHKTKKHKKLETI